MNGPTVTTCASVTNVEPGRGSATNTSVGGERTVPTCANTWAEPIASATSWPPASTDTLSGALDVQTTPAGEAAPCGSTSCADKRAVWPVAGRKTETLSMTTRLPWAGAAAVTVTVSGWLVTPPLDAVMPAVPAECPVATPPATLTTVLFDDAQEKATPVITAPCWSRASAVT